ncbi:MAG TPA: DNA recombination protein RmuC [Gammaproteobacteria bacterium]|nr:DNA recombination protein RmuC [Gammaproteobacteria bacterium]
MDIITLLMGCLTLGLMVTTIYFFGKTSKDGALLLHNQHALMLAENKLTDQALHINHLEQQVVQMTTVLEQERKQHAQRLSFLEETKQQLKHEFQSLAHTILEDKSKRFTDQNKQNIEGLLTPLREQIKDFEKKVHDVYEKESRDRLSLAQEITQLKTLNQQMSIDAVNLTSALKGESKTQGIWGEMILERVLEKSGLVKDREYTVQMHLHNDQGRAYQPDVIVHLPENKDIIIDAKVSLNAYERFCSHKNESDQQAHVQALRNHIKILSDKDYQKLVEIKTLDFVLMFIPIEGALSLAMQYDPELFSEALARNIVMVTPSTLLATLRTIENIWRFEYQNRHAQQIATKAGDLYDKFVAFVEDLDDLGRKLQSCVATYDKTHNKLSSGKGNLIKRAEDLKALGIKNSKHLNVETVEAYEV